jgi:hypothetical protein
MSLKSIMQGAVAAIGLTSLLAGTGAAYADLTPPVKPGKVSAEEEIRAALLVVCPVTNGKKVFCSRASSQRLAFIAPAVLRLAFYAARNILGVL